MYILLGYRVHAACDIFSKEETLVSSSRVECIGSLFSFSFSFSIKI